jgi:hypothetical protein
VGFQGREKMLELVLVFHKPLKNLFLYLVVCNSHLLNLVRLAVFLHLLDTLELGVLVL